MNRKKLFLIAVTALQAVSVSAQQPVAHFDMSLSDGHIVETTTGSRYAVLSALPACAADGLDGLALRFDGYSNYVKASLPTSSLSTEALTVSVVLAAESYPMMQVDVAETTPTYTAICGNIDEEGKRGFAFELSSQGDLRFRFGSSNGFLLGINGTKKLPRGQWCQLSAVLDKSANVGTLYLNGESIGTARMSRQGIVHSTGDFFIGKSAEDKLWGPFLINTFCGLIDDISISNAVEAPPTAPEGASIVPDFNYPIERYTNVAPSGDEGGAWRPRFHAMPSGSWTNETHGLVYSGGRWHVFFQKNANGPYMSRLHWGHISSENLYDWRDEPIAIAPGDPYDVKGCWSGCVYEDQGTHYILYTAVDNARATIAQARATDESLHSWEKLGVVIDGRPAGLSDDFRDPFYFEANGQKFVIVGTSKNSIGACTLHRLENGKWSNDGAIFFQGSSAQLHGTFWEMPNVTPLDGGRYLFTCTPLGTGAGVRTLCWVGTIGSDGKFVPEGDVQYLELGGISRDGFGLLSPTIIAPKAPLLSPEGDTIDPSMSSKTIEAPSGAVGGASLLLGIVPDKLPTQTNYEMGWAHNYSLPRELTVDANGQLVQKPYRGLAAMRTTTAFSKQMALSGTESLAPVSGRQIELLGEFTVQSGQCGFRFLKSGDRQASLTYDADRGTLTLDLSQLERIQNDGGTYNGVYSATLPRKVALGEKLKLHVFLDGSIADIFVCDTWAFSVRLFPTDANSTAAEAFATAEMQASLQAWMLDARQQSTGIDNLLLNDTRFGSSAIYDLRGCRISMPQHGIYIQNGRKYVAR
ncbi:MAG: GH32 C-terminal domain-containing protein [Prevotella sp.]|nr:GH32 C-terminal domain-containing protein [Prevotella sp.]